MSCQQLRPLTTLALAVFFASVSVIGCAADDDGEMEPPPDEEFSHFVNMDAKDDSQGFKQGSWEGTCVLQLVNAASLEVLEDVIHSWPARNIYQRRVGPDGIEGTPDDQPFRLLTELDSVRWVGYFTFRKLLRYAQDNDYCPGLGDETFFDGEEDDADAVVVRSMQLVSELYQEEGFARRDAHPKSHGCVRAFMDFDNGALDPSDRIGIFSQNRTYPAWIRFSNGSPIIQADNERDVRGMAIKVMGVEGEKLLERHRAQTQDFLLINGSAFFVRTPSDYVDFTRRTLDGSPVSYFLSLDPREWKIRELYNLLDIVLRRPSNPITQYWSTTPYALGPGKAVKYSARPCEDPETGWPRNPDDDFMRLALETILAERDVCFDFMIQHQIHPGGMPIEDSTIDWDPTDSPFVKAATIRIPQQSFGSEEELAFCENLSFNPWHALVEHRPLGGINRMRKVAYDALAQMRFSRNEVERREPTSHEIH